MVARLVRVKRHEKLSWMERLCARIGERRGSFEVREPPLYDPSAEDLSLERP